LEFLRGANAMDKIATRSDFRTNLPLLSALLGIWNRNFLGLPTTAIIPYSQALARFPAHLQQLDMESNGKRIDKRGHPVDFETGPIIWGEPGTNGQHSFYQSIHQGTTIVPLEFIGFKESQYRDDVIYDGTSCQEKLLSNLFAQSIALAIGQKSDNPNKFFPGNRPNRILFGERLDPFTMGAILAFYEHKVAFQGFMWNINSFDQEGVQLGKKLALKMIEQFSARRHGETIDPKEFPLGAAFLKHC
jgi:glucose-6-phosphate isomerase